jgi:hypothetical protein
MGIAPPLEKGELRGILLRVLSEALIKSFDKLRMKGNKLLRFMLSLVEA